MLLIIVYFYLRISKIKNAIKPFAALKQITIRASQSMRSYEKLKNILYFFFPILYSSQLSYL